MKKILVLHGPNLNLLGTREPAVYGAVTLDALNAGLVEKGRLESIDVHCFQSNDEGALIQAIQQAGFDGVSYLIINPAAFTHTSVAIRDALLAVNLPFIEVHISNIYAREPFRNHSYLSDIAKGCITGLGVKGYHLALQAIIDEFK